MSGGTDIEQPELSAQEEQLIQQQIDLVQPLVDQITGLTDAGLFDALGGFVGLETVPVEGGETSILPATPETEFGTTTDGSTAALSGQTELVTTDVATGEILREGDTDSQGNQIIERNGQLGILGGGSGDSFRPMETTSQPVEGFAAPTDTTAAAPTEEVVITDQGEFLSGQLADLEEAIGPAPEFEQFEFEEGDELTSEQIEALGIPTTDILDPETGETRPATMDELLEITELTATQGVQSLLEGNFGESPAALALDEIIEEERQLLDEQLAAQLGSPSAAALSTAGIQQETEFSGEVIEAQGALFLDELELLNDIALGRTTLNQEIEQAEFDRALATSEFNRESDVLTEETSINRLLTASGLETQRLDDLITASLGPFSVLDTSSGTNSALDALGGLRSDQLSADVAEAESDAGAASGFGSLFGTLGGSLLGNESLF